MNLEVLESWADADADVTRYRVRMTDESYGKHPIGTILVVSGRDELIHGSRERALQAEAERQLKAIFEREVY